MKKVILLFALISFLIPIASYAETPQEAWVARYNGTGNGEDEANAIAIDDFGNVYVTGASKGSSTGLDYATIKYDPNGNVLWTARYNGYGSGDDRAVAIAVDDLGNVYVTGESKGSSAGYDYATIKYGPSGNMLWVVRYNGPVSSDDRAHGIAVDGNGNVYVTGESKGYSTYLDYATIKYSASGNQLWVKRYNGPVNYNDIAYAIAVDINGNTYVTGESKGSGTCLDYATIKYDINGNQIWVKRYNNAANSDDSAYALALDGNGNVFVTGKSKVNAYYYDYATLKYDNNGNQKWVSLYNGTGNGNDIAHAIAVDSSGNAYVTGESKGNGSGSDYATIKLDSNGNVLWIARYNGAVNGDDIGNAIAIDSSGYVYVTGGSVNCPSDYATIKYDTNGNQVWIALYNGPANGDDIAHAIAVDNYGNVYVTGESDGTNSYPDYLTIKYGQPSAGISATPSSYNFGSVNVGSSSAPQTFTVTNTGTSNLVIGTISITGTNPGHFSKQNDNCSGQTIAPSGTCTVQAVFSPTSINGKNANLTIPSNVPTVDVPLSGTGTQAIASVSPTSHNFGNIVVGSSSGAQTFTVTNTGTSNLIIGTISLTGTDPTQFSKQNDNCSGQTIAPSGTCTVQAVFSPTSINGKNANLTIPSNVPTVDVPLSGTGTQAIASVSPTSHNFGNIVVGSSSGAQTFTVTNTGTSNLIIGTISLTGTDPTQFSKQNDNCSGQTIAPSSTCTVQAVFSPTSAGGMNANLNIPSNVPAVSALLSGTGTQAIASVSPTSHNFGDIEVGSSSAAHTFTVTNTGTANLIIGTISLTGTDPTQFSKQNDNCSSQTIAPSGTCTVQAVFSPTSMNGKNAYLSIPSNVPTVSASLSGTGTQAESLVDPSSHNFGDIEVGSSSAPHTFTVTNTGTSNLIIGTISITGTDPTQFSKQNDNCTGQTLAPSSSCTVQAVFSPTSINVKNANLTVPSNVPTVDVPLSGTGTKAIASISPTSHNFGNIEVGSSSGAQTFTVTNTGTSNLIIGTISLTGTDPTQFSKQNDNCSSQTIAPSGTCTVQAVFSPTSINVKNANLTVPSNVPTVSASLSGTGIQAIASLSPTSHNFGNIVVGSSSGAQTFTVTNTGTSNLIIGTISITGTDLTQFSKQNDNCSGQTIAPSSNCTVQAVFSPTSINVKNANLTVPSNVPTVSASLSGTGIQAIASLSPTSHNFGNIVVGSSSGAQTFTVTNTGTSNLIIGTISITGTDLTQFSKQNDNCSGQTIAPSSNCTVQAVFSPTSINVKNANLTVPSNVPTVSASLNGTGVTVAVPDIGPIADIDFGIVNVGSCVDRTTIIYNDGTATLTINYITKLSGSPEFTYIGPATPFTIPAGGSKTVTVRYCPISGSSAVFNVNSNDPDESDVTFNVTGTESVTCTIYVPQDYPTIQQAIDAAFDGCTILVSTGTYAENINFLGKAIRVKGIGTSGPCGCPTEGSSKVAISGNYNGSVVTFNTGETRDSILEGFTIKTGMAPAGGGIYIDDASPTITDCYISENLANEEAAPAFGGGIYITGSNASPLIFNNLISTNTAQSMIGEAQGGGIYVDNGAIPVIQNCTIADNHATLAGGIFISNNASLQAVDSIIWNNNFKDLYCETGCSMDVTYSDVGEDVPGIGNISKEPVFVYGSLGGYYLSHVRAGQDKDSPCIDSGSTLSVTSGLDIRNTANDGITDRGEVDMGYHYVPTPVRIQDAHPSSGTFNRGATVTHYITYRIEGNPETLYKVKIKVNIKGAYKDAFSKLETHYPGEYTIQFSRIVPNSAQQKKATITYKAILRQKGYTNIVGTDTKITEVTVQ